MKRKSRWTRIECILVLVSVLVITALGIVFYLLITQILSTGVPTLLEALSYIIALIPLLSVTVFGPNHIRKRRQKRIKIEKKLERTLTPLEIHLQKESNAPPKFFRSSFPYWTDITNGYVLRRMDLVSQLNDSLDKSGLVLVLGHSGSGKTFLSYSIGCWGLVEEKYRYVYYDNVARASKLCSSDASIYDLTESIRMCATNIADAMDEHEEFNNEKVLIILDDVHLRKDSLRSLGIVYDELPESIKTKINILLLGRVHTSSIEDEFEGWAYHLYQQRTKQLLTSFELNRQHYQEAGLELIQTFFENIQPSIECNSATQKLLVSKADQSLRIISLFLVLARKVVDNGVLNHTNIESINICDAIEVYQKDLCDDFETWRRQKQLNPISSFELKLKSILFLLATFNQMEITLVKEFLYSSLSNSKSEIDLFLEFLTSSGEIIGHYDRIAIPHLSLATSIVDCQPLTSSYKTEEGKEKLESLLIEILKIDKTPFVLKQILDYVVNSQSRWKKLVEYINTKEIDLIFQIMERFGIQIVHYIEVISDIFEDSSFKESVIYHILHSEFGSNIIESVGLIKSLNRDPDVLDAISKRIESSDNVLDIISALRRFDFMLYNDRILLALGKRINEIVESIKTSTTPWNIMMVINHPLLLKRWPIIHQTILSRSDLFAEILELGKFDEIAGMDTWRFFRILQETPCLVADERISNSLSEIIRVNEVFSEPTSIAIEESTFIDAKYLRMILNPNVILNQDCIAIQIIKSIQIKVRESSNYQEILAIMYLYNFADDDIEKAFEMRIPEITAWFENLDSSCLSTTLLRNLVGLSYYTQIEDIIKSNASMIAEFLDETPDLFIELSQFIDDILFELNPIKLLINRRSSELLIPTKNQSWPYTLIIGRIVDYVADASFLDYVIDIYLAPHKDLLRDLRYLSASDMFIKNSRVKERVISLLPEILNKLKYSAYPWFTIFEIMKYPYLIESKEIISAVLDRIDEVILFLSTEKVPIIFHVIDELSKIEFIMNEKGVSKAIEQRLDEFAKRILIEGDGEDLISYIISLARFSDYKELDEAVRERSDVISHIVKRKLLTDIELNELWRYPSILSNPSLVSEIKSAMNHDCSTD